MTARRFFLVLCLLATPALADDPAWVTATALVRTADADVQKSGLAGIGSHIPELEKAMSDGAADFPPSPGADGKAIVLVDGPAEALLALAAAANKHQDTVAHPSPYPEIGLLLALYYNETKKPEEALRALEATFKLKAVTGAFVGLHDASLLTEQAASYDSLKRWSDALASADAALKASQNDRDKARSHRSRGFNLTELGRLDDAVTAYQESLKLEPNNAVAQRELAYIARLKAGGPSAPPQIFSPGAGPAPPQPTPAAPTPPPI